MHVVRMFISCRNSEADLGQNNQRKTKYHIIYKVEDFDIAQIGYDLAHVVMI